MTGWRFFQVATASAGLVACGTDTGSRIPGPDVVVETHGDTTVVRTISGSVWRSEATLVPEVSIGELEGPEEYLFGSIYSITVDDEGRAYVLDGQARDLRVFDSDGTYIETLARRGEGPGELSNAFSVAVLPDGRIIAHEPADMLVKVLGPEPGDREQWTYSPGAVVLPVKPLRIDRNGHVLVAAARAFPDGGVSQYVLVMDAAGQLLDSLAPPGGGFEPPSLQFRLPFPIGGRSTTSVAVPLTARHHWTMNSNGGFLTGISTGYRIDVQHDDGVLRIERDYDRAFLGAVVDRGTTRGEQCPRSGQPAFRTGNVGIAGALRRIRSRRHLPGDTAHTTGIRCQPGGAHLRWRPCVVGNARRIGGPASGPLSHRRRAALSPPSSRTEATLRSGTGGRWRKRVGSSATASPWPSGPS